MIKSLLAAVAQPQAELHLLKVKKLDVCIRLLFANLVTIYQSIDCQSCYCHHQSRLLHRCGQGSLICISCDTWCPSPHEQSMPWMSGIVSFCGRHSSI